MTINLPSDQDASGRTLGTEEIDAVVEAIKSGTLTSTKGSWVKKLESRFAERLGARHAFACTSGTAAIHLAVAALDPEPGREIVTTPITDMGGITPIMYQGAIPVFADVDARTYNVTASTIERVLSDRTQAIIVTHLFGNPCEMDEIMALATTRGIPVIEDCAQAYGATFDGKPVGRFGKIGCFSLQQGKHITCGEGGLVVTDDDEIARRLFLLINKAWGYGDAKPDHYFLALNYRMNELSGAVAAAQLDKLEGAIDDRMKAAAMLTERLGDMRGIGLPLRRGPVRHTYWKYCLDVDPAIIEGGPVAFAATLRGLGVASAPRYIQKPAFDCQVIREQRTFGRSCYPFNLARPEAIDYSRGRFPGAYEALERVLVLPINERYTEAHVESVVDALHTAAREFEE